MNIEQPWFPTELTISWQVVLWVLPVVLLSVGIGMYLGRCWTLMREDRRLRREREQTLKALMALVASTKQLETDVDTHTTELASVGRTVEDLSTAGGFEAVQKTLLKQISVALDSNRRMENDLVCTRYQLEEQAQELDRTRKEARTDALSGVPNRKGFDERLQYALSSYKRTHESFALILADVDHFKWINDTHGHNAGDQVVTILGETLARCIRPNDFVARYGGDEFAILLTSIDEAAAVRVADRIRSTIEQTNFDVCRDGSRLAVAFSMGIAISEEYDTPESLLERADKALYMCKQSGRNQVRTYSEVKNQHCVA
jgi:diguanylate cyclase